MSNPDKRSVATDALDTLGHLIDESQKRDAIHLAVEPVIAGQHLLPGDHITVKGGVATRTKPGDGLGIVDPFLIGDVNTGERFWFVMYPRTIKSLRHVWTHPEFPDEPGVSRDPEPVSDKAASEAWLRDFCARSDCSSYETIIGMIKDSTDNYSDWDDEYFHCNGMDAHGEIPDEFWHHAEVVTGLTLKVRPKYFSCS